MQTIFLIMGLGTPEYIVIAIVGLLLFGRRLPEVGRSLGKSFVEFKSGLRDMQSELQEVERLSDADHNPPEEVRPNFDKPIAASESVDVQTAKEEKDSRPGNADEESS